MASNEIKDKRQLIDNRKLIETVGARAWHLGRVAGLLVPTLTSWGQCGPSPGQGAERGPGAQELGLTPKTQVGVSVGP